MSPRRACWNGHAAMFLMNECRLPLSWFMELTRLAPILLVLYLVLLLNVFGIISVPAAAPLLLAAVTTYTPSWGTSTSITITLTSLASSATAGRQSTAMTFTSTKPTDVLFTIAVSTNASTPAATKACCVYFAISEDGTNYNHDDAAVGASDAAYTTNPASNLNGPGVISCPTASKTYRKVFSLATFTGGVMPRSAVVVVCNDTNNALGTTAVASSYTEMQPQAA